MGRALLIASETVAVIATLHPFGVAGTAVNTNVSVANEQRVRVQFGVAGVLSLLAVSVDATGTGRTLTQRISGSNGNQTVSPTDTTAGVYADNTHTDAVAVAAGVNVTVVSAVGSPLYYWVRNVFTATVSHATVFANVGQSGGTGALTGPQTRFGPFCGLLDGSAVQTTEANTQVLFRVPGTAIYFNVNVGANSRSDATVFQMRPNGGNGNGVVSVGAGLTGLFTDAVNTDTVASGDLYCWTVVVGAGTGTIAPNSAGITIVNSVDNRNDIFAGGARARTRAASATPDYYFIAGQLLSVSGVEDTLKIQHGFQVSTRNFRLKLSANTYSASATATLRKNGVDVNQTLTIGAGLTGWFENTSNNDSFQAADDCDWSLVGGTSGSITLRAFGLTETENVFVIGAAASGLAGVFGSSESQGPTGAAGTGSAGTIGGADSPGFAGVAGTGALGTLLASLSDVLTGVAAAGSAGLLAASEAKTLTGVTGTGTAATLAPKGDLPLIGASATGSVGTFSGSESAGLSGVSGQGFAGNIFAAAGLTGVAATATAGSFVTSIARGLVGVVANAFAGLFGTAGPTTVGVVPRQDIINRKGHDRVIAGRGHFRSLINRKGRERVLTRRL